MNKADRKQMRRAIEKEQEAEGAQAHGTGGTGTVKLEMGFRNEDGATQTGAAQKMESVD